MGPPLLVALLRDLVDQNRPARDHRSAPPHGALHQDKHHAIYVAGDMALVQHWERALAFNGSGCILHSLYWSSMCAPGCGCKPSAGLPTDLVRRLGGHPYILCSA